MKAIFSDDNGNAQSYQIQNESTITFSDFDLTEVFFIHVKSGELIDEYVIKISDGGPVIRPRRPR